MENIHGKDPLNTIRFLIFIFFVKSLFSSIMKLDDIQRREAYTIIVLLLIFKMAYPALFSIQFQKAIKFFSIFKLSTLHPSVGKAQYMSLIKQISYTSVIFLLVEMEYPIFIPIKPTGLQQSGEKHIPFYY